LLITEVTVCIRVVLSHSPPPFKEQNATLDNFLRTF